MRPYLDLLRHIRRTGAAGEEIEIALADPLNLTGIVLPGPRTSALAQGLLRLRDGVPVPDTFPERAPDSIPAEAEPHAPASGWR